MIIWRVTTNDNQIRFNWFESKKEAAAFAKEWKADYPDSDVAVEPEKVDATRKGIVKAMNWVIDLTSFNEG